MSYDFTDPKIRDMVDRHEPTEIWGRSVSTEARTSSAVICDTCSGDWPCWPIRQLRTWREEQAKANVEALKRGST